MVDQVNVHAMLKGHAIDESLDLPQEILNRVPRRVLDIHSLE